MRKATKLNEGGHRGIPDYTHVITSTFLTFFFRIQKVATFYVFCRVSHFFSNYGYDLSHSVCSSVRLSVSHPVCELARNGWHRRAEGFRNEEDIGPIYSIHTGSEWGISSILVNYCGEEQHQRLGWSADSGTVHHHTKLVLNPLHSASGARHVILSSIGDIYKCHWQLEGPLSSPVTLLHSSHLISLQIAALYS